MKFYSKYIKNAQKSFCFLTYYYNCDKAENINKVLNNIKSIENILVENSDLLIKNFINKSDKSLINLINFWK